MGSKNQRVNRRERRKFHNKEARRLKKMTDQMSNDSSADVQSGSVSMTPAAVENIPPGMTPHDDAAPERFGDFGTPHEPEFGSAPHNSEYPTDEPVEKEEIDTNSEPGSGDVVEETVQEQNAQNAQSAKWSDDEIAILIEMTNGGRPVSEIAKSLNRSQKAVGTKKYVLKRDGRL